MSLDNTNVRESNGWLKILVLGVGLWLIPFLISFLFFTPKGELTISTGFFDSIMVVIGALLTAAFLVYYFKTVSRDFLKQAMYCAVSWFVISIVLDLVTLVSMFKMDLGKYFAEIGLGYLVIPIMALLVGFLLNEKHSHSRKVYGQIISSKKD